MTNRVSQQQGKWWHYSMLVFFHVLCLVTQSFPTLFDPTGYSPSGSSVHGDSPGKNTRVGCHALLQGIFQTQGLNLDLLHWRQILYHLIHLESPRILAWVVYPFLRGFSQSRKWTGVSCIAGGFFTSWATRVAQVYTLAPGRRIKNLLWWGSHHPWPSIILANSY